MLSSLTENNIKEKWWNIQAADFHSQRIKRHLKCRFMESILFNHCLHCKTTCSLRNNYSILSIKKSTQICDFNVKTRIGGDSPIL